MNKVYIYCDESCQDNHNYMLLGGVAIKSSLVSIFESDMDKIRKQTNMHKELKWSKLTNQKYIEYRRFVDLFFEWNKSNKLFFHCIIFDNTKINHRQFSGSYELGFYKFYYQLLLHTFGKNYGKNNDLYAFLDQRPTGYDLTELRRILNNGMDSRYKIDRRPFRLVEPADSKKIAVLQVADLVLGALGYRKNNRHKDPGTKQAKIDMSAYILAKANLREGLPNTPMTMSEFTVWNFQLSK
jgi:hypothetical protein